MNFLEAEPPEPFSLPERNIDPFGGIKSGSLFRELNADEYQWQCVTEAGNTISVTQPAPGETMVDFELDEGHYTVTYADGMLVEVYFDPQEIILTNTDTIKKLTSEEYVEDMFTRIARAPETDVNAQPLEHNVCLNDEELPLSNTEYGESAESPVEGTGIVWTFDQTDESATVGVEIDDVLKVQTRFRRNIQSAEEFFDHPSPKHLKDLVCEVMMSIE